VFEEMVVEAVEPYAVKGGTANAFAISRGGTPVTKETIDWVEYFVPAFSGEHYAANLPVGIGHKAYLEEVRARPFEPLTFGVTGVSIYQLGPAGTAQKFLWESEGIHACDCPFEE
jgi:hypothetical protein